MTRKLNDHWTFRTISVLTISRILFQSIIHLFICDSKVLLLKNPTSHASSIRHSMSHFFCPDSLKPFPGRRKLPLAIPGVEQLNQNGS